MLKAQSISIRTKLIAGISACLVVTIGVGILGVLCQRSINDDTLEIYQGDLIPILRITDVMQSVNADESALANMLISRSAEGVNIARAAVSRNDARGETAWQAYYPTISTDEERLAATAVTSSRMQLQKLAKRALDNAAKGDFDPSHSIASEDFEKAMNDISAHTGELYAENLRQAQSSYDGSQALYRKALLVTSIAVAIGLCIGAGLMSALLHAIAKPIRRAAELADEITQGRLNHIVEVNRVDEIGQLMISLGRMDEQLTSIVRKVRQAAYAISTASRQLAEGTSDLSSRAQAQAASLEETAAAMEQMTAAVQRNATHARDAASLSAIALDRAQTGQSVTDEAVAAMSDIEASSRRVVDIVALIDGIAFQTKLLSLNAAVEAARAGHEGRGFAVVAGEVRTLASQSAEAAKEIRLLVADSGEKVSMGSSLVEISKQALQDVLGNVRSSSVLVEDIAAASLQQSRGIEQVNASVVTLDETTQHTASLVEQASAASRSLQDQAVELMGHVDFFKIEEHG